MEGASAAHGTEKRGAGGGKRVSGERSERIERRVWMRVRVRVKERKREREREIAGSEQLRQRVLCV